VDSFLSAFKVFVVKSLPMSQTVADSRLKRLRIAAGISQRELARRVGVQHTNVQYWENNDAVPRAELLPSIAEALGCTVEQLLGRQPKRATPKGGKMRQLFDAASKLPRRQQEKIVSVLEPFVTEHSK
jgi:transcriptional regulator with XRE-family HTH domain